MWEGGPGHQRGGQYCWSSSALQHHCVPGLYRVPPRMSPCQLGPRPGCVSPHCPWVSIPCIVTLDWQGPHPGCMSVYHLGPHPGWLSPYCRLSPSWLHVPAPSLALCTGCGAPHWLWTHVPAVQAVHPCTRWVPVPAVSPGGHGSHLAAPGERGHPCKRRVLSLCEPGLTATHELPGRERGQ